MAHMARNGAEYGVTAGDVSVDMVKVKEYVRNAVHTVYSHENPEETEKYGIDVILGAASFINKNTVEITPLDGTSPKYQLSAKFFVVCSGATINMPGFVKAAGDGPDILTYDNLFDNTKLPERLGVLGGGPIGSEIAQAYQRLGSQVIIFAREIMPKEDPAARDVVVEAFVKDGIQHVKGRATSLTREGGKLVVGTGKESYTVDAVLVATGRSPNTKTLGFDRVGVKLTKSGGIQVDSSLRTSVPNIYAAGDCTGTIHQFTHYAGIQSAIAVRNALLPSSANGAPEPVPRVTFTDPEVAHVGLTESDHRAKYGADAMVINWGLDKVERAICEHETLGFVKLMYRQSNKQLTGATMVCSRAGEMMHEIAVAIEAKMPITKLALMMHAYPSFSFVIQEMCGKVYTADLKTGCVGWLIDKFLKK
uniref:FAD/NAD(P)-binding domain-containing protein n=1 Tax=Pyramimonas obovata TaxID=1411642 RepID=A0A7S0RZW0_9CHLO